MAAMPDQERNLRCQQHGFMGRYDPVKQVLHDVYCRRCNKRHDLYLGERGDRAACPGDSQVGAETGAGAGSAERAATERAAR